MPKSIDVICTNCPMGCKITLSIDEKNKEVLSIEGNKCKQGKQYAIAEYKNPVRVLTATIRTTSLEYPLLPVKTNKPITKDKMAEIMNILARIKISPPIKTGQVLKSNIMDIGVDLIATADLTNHL